MTKQIPLFLIFLANVRVAHWQADTLTSAHETLGELYSEMDGLVDKLVELSMGKSGERKVGTGNLPIKSNVEYSDLLATGMSLVQSTREEFKAWDDDDALNVLADMTAALNKARYLLNVK